MSPPRAFISTLIGVATLGFGLCCDQGHALAQTAKDAAALYSESVKLRQAGNLVEAEKLGQRALTVSEQIYGSKHENTAAALNNLGKVYQSRKRYTEAIALIERSFEILRAKFGEFHQDVGTSANNLAALYDEVGRYDDAEEKYRISLRVAQDKYGRSHTDTAIALGKISKMLRLQGRNSEAEKFSMESVTIFERLLGPEHPALGTASNELAAVYHALGRDVESQILYRKSLQIYEKKFGPHHYTVAVVLNNIGNLLLSQGKVNEAEQFLSRALSIYERFSEESRGMSDVLNNLANVYREQERFSDAEKLFRKSIHIDERILGIDHPSIATSFSNLAVLLKTAGRYQDAEDLLQSSLSIIKESLGVSHPAFALGLNNLALLFGAQNRFTEAKPLLENAVSVLERTFGPDHRQTIATKNNLLEVYGLLGQYQEALELIREMSPSGKLVPSVAFLSIYGAQETGLISDSEAFSLGFNLAQQDGSGAALAVQKFAQRIGTSDPLLAGLIRADQDLENQTKQLESLLNESLSKHPEQRSHAVESNLRKHLSSISGEKKKNLDELVSKFPEYVSLARPDPVPLSELQSLLSGDEAVVVFHIGKVESFSWVVTKTEGNWLRLNTNQRSVEDRIRTLRLALDTDEDVPFPVNVAYEIYQETFGQLTARLSGKKHLSVISNGALTSIPYSLFVRSEATDSRLENVDWFVRTFSSTTLPSVFSLKTMRSNRGRASSSKPMIGFGDPVFSRGEGLTRSTHREVRSLANFYQGSEVNLRLLGQALDQLPSTRIEVTKVAKFLGASTTDIILGASATETAVKKARLDQYKIVYFATHGLVAGDIQKFTKARAEPALAFSLPIRATEEDDGLLQSSEIALLRLNADWVVLSACNTASSDGLGAEPLSGLARAFLYAGARSLLASHWRVDDSATASLMTDLFQIVAQSPYFSHGEALREAQLRFLAKTQNNEERHPRYWAPFVVIGEPSKTKQ